MFNLKDKDMHSVSVLYFTDQLADALFAHGNTEQAVHAGHRHRVVGDDQEAGFGAPAHLVEKIAEARHVGVV